MMDLDEELTLQIKTVFENFDDGESDMGWAQLRTKSSKDSDRKLPLYWLGGIAASLLVVFGLWFFKKPAQQIEENQPLVVHQEKAKPAIEKPVAEQKNAATVNGNNQVVVIPLSTKPTTNRNTQLNPVKEQRLVKTNPIVSITVKKKIDLQTDAIQVDQNRTTRIKTEAQNNNAPINTVETNPTQVAVTNVENQKINSQTNNGQFGNTPITQVIANSNKIDSNKVAKTDQQVAKSIVNTTVEPSIQKKTTEEFLKEQSKSATAKIAKKEKKEKNNKNSYEVFTGTFLNYYADNEVKVNAGFGLNANLKVAKGLFLSVGAGISQNQISSQTNISPVVSKEVNSTFSSFAKPSSTTTLKTEPVVTNVRLSAQLLSLDLPISVKFYPSKKQNFYLSTGLNSNSYFAQKYDYTYTAVSSSPLLATAKSADREETEKSKFKGFDLANSAIFAIGVTQRIGANNLIFEPYFKPAIGNMGDKNLKINTVGLNLKFNFNNADKK